MRIFFKSVYESLCISVYALYYKVVFTYLEPALTSQFHLLKTGDLRLSLTSTNFTDSNNSIAVPPSPCPTRGVVGSVLVQKYQASIATRIALRINNKGL